MIGLGSDKKHIPFDCRSDSQKLSELFPQRLQAVWLLPGPCSVYLPRTLSPGPTLDTLWVWVHHYDSTEPSDICNCISNNCVLCCIHPPRNCPVQNSTLHWFCTHITTTSHFYSFLKSTYLLLTKRKPGHRSESLSLIFGLFPNFHENSPTQLRIGIPLCLWYQGLQPTLRASGSSVENQNPLISRTASNLFQARPWGWRSRRRARERKSGCRFFKSKRVEVEGDVEANLCKTHFWF